MAEERRPTTEQETWSLEQEEAEARRTAARLLGMAQSERKTRAARKNGKLGGRPRGVRQSEKTKRKISETKRAKGTLRG